MCRGYHGYAQAWQQVTGDPHAVSPGAEARWAAEPDPGERSPKASNFPHGSGLRDRPHSNRWASRGGQGDSLAIAVLLGENFSGSRFHCGAAYLASYRAVL